MYEKLKIDFPIPKSLEEFIDEFMNHINNEDGHMEDYYRMEIDFQLKEWHTGLTKEQTQLLRDYYVHRGIYKKEGPPWKKK